MTTENAVERLIEMFRRIEKPDVFDEAAKTHLECAGETFGLATEHWRVAAIARSSGSEYIANAWEENAQALELTADAWHDQAMALVGAPWLGASCRRAAAVSAAMAERQWLRAVAAWLLVERPHAATAAKHAAAAWEREKDKRKDAAEDEMTRQEKYDRAYRESCEGRNRALDARELAFKARCRTIVG